MQILAVDDDPIILSLLESFVSSNTDHFLITASSGPQALRIIAASTDGAIDCFMLDIKMPGMDGIELCRKIRSLQPTSPIIMLTTLTEKDSIDAAFVAGATDYATKPFEIHELAGRLSAANNLVTVKKLYGSQSPVVLAEKTQQAICALPIKLADPVPILDVDRVIDPTALENYVVQLSRAKLFTSTALSVTIRQIDVFHAAMSGFEFHCLITDMAAVISDTLSGDQVLISYVGNGTFSIVSEARGAQERCNMIDALNLCVAKSEFYLNNGTRIAPRLAIGRSIRLVWRSGSAALQALGEAIDSAENAATEREKYLDDVWFMGTGN